MVVDPPRETELPLTVTELLARFAFVIPAEPLKFVFVNPVMVLEPAAIVLLVRVCDKEIPANVSVPFGAVIVPDVLRVSVPDPLMRFVAVLPDNVLLVRVAVIVSDTIGSLTVPL
jgi:hypothetical protein